MLCGPNDPRISIFSHNFMIYRRGRLFVPVKCLRVAHARWFACNFAPSGVTPPAVSNSSGHFGGNNGRNSRFAVILHSSPFSR